MRIYMLATILTLVLSGCGPVLDQTLTKNAFVNVPLASMMQNPLLYQNDVYLLGGLILRARETDDGLLVQSLYIPVNRRGFIKDQVLAGGEFLVSIPLTLAVDPDKCRPGVYISLAAEFDGTHTGLAGETKAYPFFRARDIHLWGERYPKAFTLPSGKMTSQKPAEPMPVWENPIVP